MRTGENLREVRRWEEKKDEREGNHGHIQMNNHTEALES